MNAHKSVPAPETVQSGTYEKANAILEKERADKLTEDISDSAKRECDAAYERYQNAAAMNEADNELADSPGWNEDTNNCCGVTDNKNVSPDNRGFKKPTSDSAAEIERAMCEAQKIEAEVGMKHLTQIGIELAAKSGFIADSMTVNIGDAHESVRVSGKNARGDHFHIELSRADASAFERVCTGI